MPAQTPHAASGSFLELTSAALEKLEGSAAAQLQAAAEVRLPPADLEAAWKWLCLLACGLLCGAGGEMT